MSETTRSSTQHSLQIGPDPIEPIWVRWLLGILITAAALVSIGVLSDSPHHRILADDMSELKLMVRHSGKPLQPCRTRPDEELAGLAPNMRQALTCPREKSALFMELTVAGEVVLGEEIHPSGLHRDGVLARFVRIPLPLGDVPLRLRVKEHAADADFSHDQQTVVTVTPSSIVVLQFTDQGIRIYQPGAIEDIIAVDTTDGSAQAAALNVSRPAS